MATQIERTHLRGFLVHDTRLAVWDAETTATEAGPRAGEAVPTARADDSYPELGLQASGEQTAGTVLTVTVQQGGHLGDCAIAWADAVQTDPRGWDNPVHPCMYEPAGWGISATLPDCEAGSDGAVYAIVYDATNFSVDVRKRNPLSEAWSTEELYDTSTDPGQSLSGCLAVDAAGNVWAWHWTVDTVASRATLRSYVRRPGASSWAVVQYAALERDLSVGDYTLGRLRAAINQEGQVCLLGHLMPVGGSPAADVIWQWAAEHPAAPLREVLTDSGSRGYPEVLVKDGAFWCFYLTYNTASPGEEGLPILRVIGSAWQSLDSATAINFRDGLAVIEAKVSATPAFTEGSLAAVITEDGTVYVFTNRYGATTGTTTVAGGVYRFRGTLAAPRGGEVHGWDQLGAGSSATWFDDATTGNATEYPRYYAACVTRGRVILVTNFQATTAATRAYLGAYYLGGWSNYPRPSRYTSITDPDRDPLEMAFVPIAGPASMGWTAAGAGTGTLVAGAWNIATTIAQTLDYTQTAAVTAGRGYVRYALKVNTGGSLAFPYVSLSFGVSDGANDWLVQVNHALSGGTQQLRIKDSAGTQIGSDVDTEQADDIEIMVAVVKVSTVASLVVLWRVWSTNEDTYWTVAATSSTLPSSAAVTSSIVWGHQTAAIGDSTWRYVLWSWNAGPTTLARATYPQEMPGAILGASPRWLGKGVQVLGQDGPGVYGDAWTITADAEFALERLDPQLHPSPSETWRAEGVGAMDLAWQLGTSGVDTYLGADLLGAYVTGATTRQLILSGYQAGSGWSTLGTLDLAEGRSSLPYTREGDTIRPQVGGTYTQEPYFYAGELVGATVALGFAKYRRVRWNSDGWWSVDAGKRRCVIELEGVDGTEGANGTCAIWSTRGLLVVNLLGEAYTGFKLSIPSQANVAGYHELGQVVIGPLHTFARYFARGGQQTRRALAELVELVNGYRSARRLNDPRRLWTIPIADLYDEAELELGTGRYSLGTDTSGGLVLANVGDEWSRIDGLLQYLDGGTVPCVYVPSIEVSVSGAADEQTHVAERHTLYGRLGAEVTREHVAGEIETGWAWRGVDALVIEEER